MHTPENLTTALINQVRDEAMDVDDVETAWACHVALVGDRRARAAARQRVAEHLNLVAQREAKS